MFLFGGAEVTLKAWAPQDPGAAAITDLKKELSQRSRALQIPDDGCVPWPPCEVELVFLVGVLPEGTFGISSSCRWWCP